ncbi:MAG: hypothetical protein LBG07_03340, partial [Treponema sp.]|nr:hypothetical protein [Treponema sp.]
MGESPVFRTRIPFRRRGKGPGSFPVSGGGSPGELGLWLMALPPLALAALAFIFPYAASLALGFRVLAGAGRDHLALVLSVLPVLGFTV